MYLLDGGECVATIVYGADEQGVKRYAPGELFGEKAPGAGPGTPASSKPYSPSSPQPRKNSFGRPAVRFAAPAAAPKSPGPSNVKALDV